jgi:serine/threonine protein kinase
VKCGKAELAAADKTAGLSYVVQTLARHERLSGAKPKLTMLQRKYDRDLFWFIWASGKYGTVDHELRRSLMFDVIRGVVELHGLELLHLDLKPANILLRDINRELHARIGDLGALVENGERSFGSTRWYMAPDMAKKVKQELEDAAREQRPYAFPRHSKADDVFSLGCLLWELETGRMPPIPGFGAEGDDDVLLGMRADATQAVLDARGLKHVEGETRMMSLLKDMLAADAERRPPIAKVRDRFVRAMFERPAPT